MVRQPCGWLSLTSWPRGQKLPFSIRNGGGFDRIEAVSDDIRDLAEESFPDLPAKLPPRKPPPPSAVRPRGR